MEKKFITIKDVAKESGFSINTVSRALNDKPYVDAETKEKIIKVAKKLNYVKNTTATSLRYSKTKTVGVVFVDAYNPFYSEILKGIEISARKYDYQIILMNTDRNYKNEEKAIDTLIQRRVDGLIITAVQTQKNDLKRLEKMKFPTVLVGSHDENSSICEIYIDDEKGGYIATEHLIERKRKKIFLFNTFEFKYVAKKREEGYKRALENYGIKYDEKNIIKSTEGYENAYKTFYEYIEKNGLHMDALFCYNDIFALAALQVFKEKKIKVPKDIALVGFDNILFSKLSDPSITTINIDKFELGFKSFESLYYQMENKNKSRCSKMFDVEIVIREST